MEFMGMHEADVTINGKPLTFGQSMALRVAVGAFLMSVTDPGRAKQLGPIAESYAERLHEVNAAIFRTFKKEGA